MWILFLGLLLAGEKEEQEMKTYTTKVLVDKEKMQNEIYAFPATKETYLQFLQIVPDECKISNKNKHVDCSCTFCTETNDLKLVKVYRNGVLCETREQIIKIGNICRECHKEILRIHKLNLNNFKEIKVLRNRSHVLFKYMFMNKMLNMEKKIRLVYDLLINYLNAKYKQQLIEGLVFDTATEKIFRHILFMEGETKIDRDEIYRDQQNARSVKFNSFKDKKDSRYVNFTSLDPNSLASLHEKIAGALIRQMPSFIYCHPHEMGTDEQNTFIDDLIVTDDNVRDVALILREYKIRSLYGKEMDVYEFMSHFTDYLNIKMTEVKYYNTLIRLLMRHAYTYNNFIYLERDLVKTTFFDMKIKNLEFLTGKFNLVLNNDRYCVTGDGYVLISVILDYNNEEKISKFAFVNIKTLYDLLQSIKKPADTDDKEIDEILNRSKRGFVKSFGDLKILTYEEIQFVDKISYDGIEINLDDCLTTIDPGNKILIEKSLQISVEQNDFKILQKQPITLISLYNQYAPVLLSKSFPMRIIIGILLVGILLLVICIGIIMIDNYLDEMDVEYNIMHRYYKNK